MSGLPPLPHQTARLSLRRFVPEDFAAYADCHRRAEVYRHLYTAPPEGEALAQQFARACDPRFEDEGDAFRLAVCRQTDGALLGEVVLKYANRIARQGELGYIFHPDYAGQGYATEAAGAMLALGFGPCGLHRIFARIASRNEASWRLADRLGLRREAHLVENDFFEGVWGDEFIYALLGREWRNRG